MDKKPSVFPQTKEEPKKYTINTAVVTDKNSFLKDFYDDNPNGKSAGNIQGIIEMKERTQEQLEIKKEGGVVQYPELSEYNQKLQKRVKPLKKEQIPEIKQDYTYQKPITNNINKPNTYTMQTQQPYNKPQEPINVGRVKMDVDSYISGISQPDFDTAFDVLKIPSEGKIYNPRKKNLNVAHMTTFDENILTSPNLLESGQFLEILINRKLLHTDLRYADLHMGDRNAIMIWLRASAYGDSYPITVFDEKGVPFEVDVNLSDLQFKKLGVEPDDEGLFDYKFNLSGDIIKFKFLTCGDSEIIENKLKEEEEMGLPINNANTYLIQKLIVEVNGNRDTGMINEYAKKIRMKDASVFIKYYNDIESGVDTILKIPSPSGVVMDVNLPLNVNFFWPDIRV